MVDRVRGGDSAKVPVGHRGLDIHDACPVPPLTGHLYCAGT